jgi:hypothetical protein
MRKLDLLARRADERRVCAKVLRMSFELGLLREN